MKLTQVQPKAHNLSDGILKAPRKERPYKRSSLTLIGALETNNFNLKPLPYEIRPSIY